MYPEAYINFLVYFHGNRDYFECHDVLEEHWQKNDEHKAVWNGLIKLAVAFYHYRRHNFIGALKLMNKSLTILSNEPEALESLGLDPDRLLLTLKEQLKAIKEDQPYASINLPILDEKLLSQCKEKCRQMGLVWGAASDFSNSELIDKHLFNRKSKNVEKRPEKY